MKLRSILTLAALIVSILSPFTAHISIFPTDQAKYFVSLDICDASGAFVSADADTPLLHECACKPVPFECAEYIKGNDLAFIPSLYSIQVEHPPKS
jgi:hypothetical protein